MYAIIKTGGKQYKVCKGDHIQIDKLEVAADSTVHFDKVLVLSDADDVNIGTPYLADTVVSGKVVRSAKKNKIKVIKFKRRKCYTRTAGHRQAFSEIEITDIKKTSGEDSGT
ncbi:MAG: 50S ribosomal protein L21 [Chromatiales bacterium]|nr:50S ribosomal protein L21 [Chromatiales bacterium]